MNGGSGRMVDNSEVCQTFASSGSFPVGRGSYVWMIRGTDQNTAMTALKVIGYCFNAENRKDPPLTRQD